MWAYPGENQPGRAFRYKSSAPYGHVSFAVLNGCGACGLFAAIPYAASVLKKQSEEHLF